MKHIFLSLTILGLFFSLSPVQVSAQQDDEPSRSTHEAGWVTFKKALKNPAAVKKLAIVGVDSLRYDLLFKFKSIEGLVIRDTELSDLRFLDSFPNIKELELHGNSLHSLEGIQNLDKLRELTVDANFISDLTPLSELYSIVVLDINNNEIKDLEPLRNLHSLLALNIARNPFQSIQPICDMTQLKSLSLFDCPNVSDISCIESFTDMRFLNISLLNIPDFSLVTISKMDSMDNLRIQGMVKSNEELTYLLKMSNMAQLTMGLNPNVDNIDCLRHFKKLEYLDIHGNNIPTLDVTTHFPRLVKLVCYNNPIHSISVLAQHIELRALFIHNLELDNYDVLEDFIQLQYLSIDEKGIGKENLEELKRKLPNTEFTVY